MILNNSIDTVNELIVRPLGVATKHIIIYYEPLQIFVSIQHHPGACHYQLYCV